MHSRINKRFLILVLFPILSFSTSHAGAFSPLLNTRIDYVAGKWASSVTIGNLNGDGRLDLTVANQQSHTEPCPVPSRTTLLSPPDGATDVSTSLTLIWEAVADTSSYAVTVCTDSACTTPVRFADNLT